MRCVIATHRVYVSDDSSDSRQPRPSTGNNTNILVRVLASLSTPVVVIVKVCDSLAER